MPRMPSLMDLPTEVRLRIWGYILPRVVGVSMDEYIARTRVVFSPEGTPIVLHRVAYATTTAAHLRCLNRQIYAEILSIPPPLLCPRIEHRYIHQTVGRCRLLIKRSLRRIKVLGTREAGAAECLLGYFKHVEIVGRSPRAHDDICLDDLWIEFAVSRPYIDTDRFTKYRVDADDRSCCNMLGRPFWFTGEESDGESDEDVEDYEFYDEDNGTKF